MKSKRLFPRALLISLILLTYGCSTEQYYTHYGSFYAENSKGEERQFRVYWQTTKQEGWNQNRHFRATPITLDSQCSKRKQTFKDLSQGYSQSCRPKGKEGVFICGNRGEDLALNGLPVSEKSICGSVTNNKGDKEIALFNDEILLSVFCYPVKTEFKDGDDTINKDLLKASSVPYKVAIKTIPGALDEDKLPYMSHKGCNAK